MLESLIQNNLKTALATAAVKDKVRVVLEITGLNKYFSVVVTADEVSKGKPDPETFLKAAGKLSCKPEECVVIEDATNGIRAAKNANMKCIAITTTHHRAELEEADKTVESFAELTAETIKNL